MFEIIQFILIGTLGYFMIVGLYYRFIKPWETATHPLYPPPIPPPTYPPAENAEQIAIRAERNRLKKLQILEGNP